MLNLIFIDNIEITGQIPGTNMETETSAGLSECNESEALLEDFYS